MMAKAFYWSRNVRNDVYVRKFRSQHQRQRGQRSLPVQAAAADRCACKKMCERVQVRQEILRNTLPDGGKSEGPKHSDTKALSKANLPAGPPSKDRV